MGSTRHVDLCPVFVAGPEFRNASTSFRVNFRAQREGKCRIHDYEDSAAFFLEINDVGCFYKNVFIR
jgi:hypothetical protein